MPLAAQCVISDLAIRNRAYNNFVTVYMEKEEFKPYQPSLATYQQHIWDSAHSNMAWYEYDKAYRYERSKEKSKQD